MLGLRTIVLLTTLFFATRQDQKVIATCSKTGYLLINEPVNAGHDIQVACGNCKTVEYPATGYDMLAKCTSCGGGATLSRPQPYIIDGVLNRTTGEIFALRMVDFGYQCVIRKQGKAGSVVAVGLVLLTSMFLSF